MILQPGGSSILQEFRSHRLRIIVCAFVAVSRGGSVSNLLSPLRLAAWNLERPSAVAAPSSKGTV